MIGLSFVVARADDLGVRVAAPHLQQVVQAHLRLVSERTEFGEADPQGLRVLEDRDAQCPALGDQRDSAAERGRGRERRVHPDVGMGVDDPHAVRTDHRQVVSPAHVDESGFALESDAPDFPESRRDDHESSCALTAALFGGPDREVGGHRDDREIDRVRDVAYVRVGSESVDAPRVGIHGIEDSLIFVQDEIP